MSGNIQSEQIFNALRKYLDSPNLPSNIHVLPAVMPVVNFPIWKGGFAAFLECGGVPDAYYEICTVPKDEEWDWLGFYVVVDALQDIDFIDVTPPERDWYWDVDWGKPSDPHWVVYGALAAGATLVRFEQSIMLPAETLVRFYGKGTNDWFLWYKKRKW